MKVNSCARKLGQLSWCLSALSGNDFTGSLCTQRDLTKLNWDRLLRQQN